VAHREDSLLCRDHNTSIKAVFITKIKHTPVLLDVVDMKALEAGLLALRIFRGRGGGGRRFSPV
jgi:hypothetical protein